MLFANSNFKDLLVEGALSNSGIEIQCVSEHVWVRHGGLRGRGGELPAGGIRASQGTFSSNMINNSMVMDITQIIHGPQLILEYIYTF